MPIERAPRHPLPVNYIPEGGIPYRVKDGDDWISIALSNRISVKELIYFNFSTNDPDEINWYLHRNTGCKKITRDGKNWMFSSDSIPGIIYIPQTRLEMDPLLILGKQGNIIKLAQIIPKAPDNSLGHKIHYILEAVEGVEVGLAIAGTEVLILSPMLAVAAPLAGEAAVILAIANAYADAFNHLVKEEINSGFSRGVVLGADRRKRSFVKSYFVRHGPVYSPNPAVTDQGKRLQDAYNYALVAGYAYGKQLNTYQSTRFFLDLHSRMSPSPQETYGPDSANWNERTWVNYYIECAAVFRRHHLI